MYTGQHPWAGHTPAQLVNMLTVERARLEFPFGTPEPLEVRLLPALHGCLIDRKLSIYYSTVIRLQS